MKFAFLSVVCLVSTLANAGGSHLNGQDVELAWAISAQISEEFNYEVKYIGFATDKPKIIALEKLDKKTDSSREMIEFFADRYAKCIGIAIDDEDKTITVTPRDLVYVKSEHVTESTYTVEGKEPFSLKSEVEERMRYFCVYDVNLLQHEWQKKAFLE